MDEQELSFDEQLDQMLEQQDNQLPQPKKPRKKRGALIAVAVILLLLLLLAVFAGVYANYLLDRLGDYDPSNNVTVSPDQADDIVGSDPGLKPVDPNDNIPGIGDLTDPSGGETIDKNKDVVNILIVGQDSSSSAIRTRSDTMILVSVHTKAKQVTLTSFMRDAYVKIPGYASNKLNHAYQFGGLKLLNETLKVNFGVEVDGNVVIDFSSFKQVIDLLGGVDISLTKMEAIYLVNGGKHDVHVGMNRLNGQQALDYARLREIDSDYQRTNRQRTVILSIMERYKSLPVDEMLMMLDQILPLIVTDMENAQILDYALRCAPVAATASYGTQQIPANGTFSQGFVQVRDGLKNWFQYNIDFNENRRILQNIMDGKR